MFPTPYVNPLTRPVNVTIVQADKDDETDKTKKAKRRVRADWREAALLGLGHFPMNHTIVC